MSEYQRCETCGEFGWVETHRCPPAWDVRLDGEERLRAVFAIADRYAAELFVERCYEDLDGPRLVAIGVRKHGSSGPWKLFDVEVDWVPEATATYVGESAPQTT